MVPTHPRTREVFDYLVTARVHLEDAVRQVPERVRNARPAPDRWCLAEILEHLARVSEGITRLINTRVAAGREAGLGPDQETTSILWTLDVARLLDRREKMEAPERIVPTGNLSADAAWSELVRAGDALQNAVVAADGLALGSITHPHRFLGPLNLYQWIAFAAAHEFRHAAQVRELAA
jgi:uncharacterized damage-inducible protein DinB